MIIELNGLRNNRLLLLSTIMADSLRDDNAAPGNKRAARSEKTVIVGERREEKGEGNEDEMKRDGGKSAEKKSCHTRTTDSTDPLLLHALIPAIRARVSHCASANEHHSHKSSLLTSFSVAIPEEDIRRCSLSA